MDRAYKNIINSGERSHPFIYKNVSPALPLDVTMAARLSVFLLLNQ